MIKISFLQYYRYLKIILASYFHVKTNRPSKWMLDRVPKVWYRKCPGQTALQYLTCCTHILHFFCLSSF